MATTPSLLEANHATPLLQTFPTVDTPASYIRALAACHTLSTISFSEEDKAQLKNALNALAAIHAGASTNAQLLDAQAEVKQAFEQAIGVSQVANGDQGESLQEKVLKRGGQEAVRALQSSEIPKPGPDAAAAPTSSQTAPAERDTGTTSTPTASQPTAAQAAQPSTPSSATTPPSDVFAVKRPSTLTLVPGPCTTAKAARELDQHLDYLNEWLARDARLRDRTLKKFHEVTRGTDSYILKVYPYNSPMKPKVRKVQEFMDQVARGEI